MVAMVFYVFSQDFVKMLLFPVVARPLDTRTSVRVFSSMESDGRSNSPLEKVAD